jgi:SAM-dependent methyltransferase
VPPLLYRELAPWYRLVDPPSDHGGEAALYRAAIERTASPPAGTLLELGAGAGGNASHLKGRFQCTLVDLSGQMLALSRELNPECEHLLGDMRSLRLGRVFDAVLIHDAIAYLTTPQELEAALRTALLHTRPGGAGLFAPDFFRESFREGEAMLSGEDGPRALRGLEWTWDPDPADGTIQVEYAFLLREGGQVRSVHDRHLEGLFSRDTWLRLLGEVGWRVEEAAKPAGDLGELIVCRRP